MVTGYCRSSYYYIWCKVKFAKVLSSSDTRWLIHRALQALLYVAMGWTGLTLYAYFIEISPKFRLPSLYAALQTRALTFMVASGLSYSLGIAFEYLKITSQVLSSMPQEHQICFQSILDFTRCFTCLWSLEDQVLAWSSGKKLYWSSNWENILLYKSTKTPSYEIRNLLLAVKIYLTWWIVLSMLDWYPSCWSPYQCT